MPHGPEHHLEEAQHAQHAQHGPPDPFTTRVAMTMAIVAAALACVSLLSHREHNETLQHRIGANDNFTLASNQWGYYQAKKNRQYLLEADAKMLQLLPARSETADQVAKTTTDWNETATRYEQETKAIEEKARGYEAKASEEKKESDSHHHRGGFLDFGELGMQLALVLCSIAVLTKRSFFWISGILIGVIGLGIALWSFVPVGH
jgi:hypothetical protein